MNLRACCFLQNQREEAAPTFRQDVNAEKATEQLPAVFVTGKPQAWLMTLCNRISPGVPGKARKFKASYQRTQKKLSNVFI